ncbi:DUF190 domain-containing protein [Desulfobotulus sp. H1]|uniref:DUF190 domain-containing protein n=1 Tax=Desulfobotulus pelophilus TaxID=2823377 RepID=A0ABT3NDL8_9BACT|nr:DUF190 domain-containing protein [Desulfobotulus pelophilus]MCW7755027.1 DUF190 domain-containing protein [Desulfobotulus pelophilus]
MKLLDEGQLLRIYIGESDTYEKIPLYEWLVIEAKKQGLAGATVFRGIMGFGANSRIHTSKILRLSFDLPIIVDIVDSPDRIQNFLASVGDVIHSGLVILENTRVHLYRNNVQP